ncbi:PEP/pyruvate-binding domain-containing protein [Kitasatospora cystarginea]|uniref:PEP/pyruvate-binding domain-containing protein n=1 Tax=Kitasatospora cystarginea TaxID=58350 RepID=A0ABP5RSY3_9ACTN
MAYLIPLAQLGLHDVDRVGRKAAVLGELRQTGFRVPDGFGVPWQVLTDVLDGIDPADPHAVVERIRCTELPDALRAELSAALRELGDGPVAVRSSGIEEDLAGRSFAGQYDSVLDVRGADAVADALRQCWASAFSDRVAAYRNGEDAPMRMGVLVQAMVPAAAAGVAFSANPVTGDRGETMVSAVTGLGDRLMAGETVADEWSVRDGTAQLLSGSREAVTEAQVCEVEALVGRVAEHFGTPQDIEWAFAAGELWLLQARPITTLVEDHDLVPIDIEVPPGFFVRDVRSPDARAPMENSVFLPVFAASAKRLFDFTTGAPLTATTIGGWVYLNPLPDTMPELIRRSERIAELVAEGAPLAVVRRWESEWKPGFVARIRRLRETDLGAVDDAALAAHVAELTGFFSELHDVYFRIAGAAMFIGAELGLLAQELLDWPPDDLLPLRSGLVGEHMGAVVALGDLARLAAAKPALSAALERDVQSAVGQLRDMEPEFAAAFDRYLADYGHRTLRLGLTDPTFAEQPAMVLTMVVAQLGEPFDLADRRAVLARRVQPRRDELERRLAGRPAAERQQFEAALAAAELSAPIRDEKSHLAVSLWALMRYAVLELGNRLAGSALIQQPEDVFLIGLDQALAALADPCDLRPAVRLGRGQLNWAKANPGPRFYGTPPTPPTWGPGMAEPSEAAKHVMDIAAWTTRMMGGSPQAPAETDGISGLAAAAGRYTGPARVVGGPRDFGKLRRGDVLVCPETTAQWAVLFPSLGALVADGGSLLSHPAILSREYGIPAVVAAGDATRLLQDGDLVEVDGAAGTVRLISGSIAARRSEAAR